MKRGTSLIFDNFKQIETNRGVLLFRKAFCFFFSRFPVRSRLTLVLPMTCYALPTTPNESTTPSYYTLLHRFRVLSRYPALYYFIVIYCYRYILKVEEDDIRLSFIHESSRHRSNGGRVTSFNSCNYCLSRWLRLVGLH